MKKKIALALAAVMTFAMAVPTSLMAASTATPAPRITASIEKGEKINELEMIYLSLYNKNRRTAELLKDTIPFQAGNGPRIRFVRKA